MKKLSSLPRHAPDSQNHSQLRGWAGRHDLMVENCGNGPRGTDPKHGTYALRNTNTLMLFTINSNNNDTVQIDLAEFAKTC